MAVTVSKKFKENFDITVAYWKSLGDSDEQIAELKALIRSDLADGEGAMRDPAHLIEDPAVRRKLWEDYFQSIADQQRGIGSAEGINDRIVNPILSEKDGAK